MTNVTSTATDLATYYSELGNWIGLAVGPPGASSAPTNEASGGSPPYARQSTIWTVTGASVLGSAVTFNVPAGTYSYMCLFSASAGSTMLDWAPIAPQVCAAQTTITITPLVTAS